MFEGANRWTLEHVSQVLKYINISNHTISFDDKHKTHWWETMKYKGGNLKLGRILRYFKSFSLFYKSIEISPILLKKDVKTTITLFFFYMS